jgi:hypothetical protein
MTALLNRAMAELEKRPTQEQDAIARDILARIGEPQAHAQQSVIGRGASVLRFTDPSDDMVDILTEADVHAWFADKAVEG